MSKFIFAVAISFLSFCLWARSWERVTIADARCGHGGDYHVFISGGDPEKWAVVLQGGGACWDFLSCATNITTKMGTQTTVKEKFGIMADDPTESPIADYSVIYFPYCTGDLFAGEHTAIYSPILKSRHWGRRNLVLAFEQLSKREIIKLAQAKKVFLYGASAGGLGMVLNLPWLLNEYIDPSAQVYAIADGMGLHWNSDIWKRFKIERILELKNLFGELNVPFSRIDGLLAKYVNTVCDQYPEVRFGILQGSMDLTMSVFFGQMSPWSHRRRVYGEKGVYKMTLAPDDNCAAWVPDTYRHTFIDGLKPVARTRTSSGETAVQFVKAVMSGKNLSSER